MARKRIPKHEVIRIGSWSSFVELATGDELKNWAFRGHAEESWPLNSTLARHLIDHRIHKSVWAHQEKRILRIFRRKAHHFMEHLPAADDSFCWLALMQHHGAPTRLLDLTWSPYVAAFFALERATGPAAVWAFNAAAIECQTRNILGGEEGEFNPREPGHLERYVFLSKHETVTIGEPNVMNQRLIAQGGTFALQGSLRASVDEILAGYSSRERPYFIKLQIDTSRVRRDAMRELYNMNITQATLFPGLDGLARSLAYELEFHWAFQPKTGRLYDGYFWAEGENGIREPQYD